MTARRSERARAALAGLAIGDALGMPTQMMSRAAIAARFGVIHEFRAAAPDHPTAAGLQAGSVTDDTEQALLLARHLIAGRGRADPAQFAKDLVQWEDGMRERGSLDLLGPSTKRAVEAIAAGEPLERAGRFGTTNGAAMRVTPVGIAVPPHDLGNLVDRVVETCVASHNTGVAIAAACAVAAAISAGIEGASFHEATAVAIRAAGGGSLRGHWVAAPDIARRVRWAVELVDPGDPERSLSDIYGLVGTSIASQESIPAAFGLLATFPGDTWRAVLAAASLGGDSDTIAAITGAIGGATSGLDRPMVGALAIVEHVNGIRLAPVVDALLALRMAG